MGRRSINTTKSGKYMNPTDQARKEARKKELKKNKKQRQMVRAAVLKMKDPSQILEELEKIDEMEYNVLQPSPLNEKVLKEKRKKLKETLERVLKMYDKDEPEKWVELKRQESEYERRRTTLAAYHESVRHAQAVQIDDIPLPTLQIPDNLIYGNVPSQIPLPMELTPSALPMPPMKPVSILKKDSYYKEVSSGMEPPGVPPGPPPSLADLAEEENMETDDKNAQRRTRQKTLRFSDQIEIERKRDMDRRQNKMDYESHPMDHDDRVHDSDDRIPPPGVVPMAAAMTSKPTSLQQRMLALSGQNIDEFMKEMEEVHKKREMDRQADLNNRLSERQLEESNSEEEDHSADKDDRMIVPHMMCPPGTMGMEGPSMAAHPPPLMGTMLRPPPLRPLGMPPPGLRIPLPLPPPNRGAPPGPPPGLPPRLIRLPPGPPPGLPPRGLPLPIPRPLGQSIQLPINFPLPVLSAAPQLINRKEGQPQSVTITAKPQIRNLSADVTRFVPSALRVKREDNKKVKPGPQRPVLDLKKLVDVTQKPPGAPTKDDAYMQFMNEMQGLL